MVYVSHTCKNINRRESDLRYCDNAFMDKDLKKSTSESPKWKYCPDCVLKGFINPLEPPKNKGVSERMKNRNKKNLL